MTVDVASIAPTVLITSATVRRAERLSPAFVRVTLESPDFVDLGRDEGFDTRFKLILPGPTGALPDIPVRPEEWYAGWLAMPDEVRSPMRTYTVREVLVEGVDVLLVVDLVVHPEQDGDHGGGLGPACRWALTARPGDLVQVIAPHRRAAEVGGYGGTEFAPGGRRELLLVGDETAVPAIARILADLGPGYSGQVFLEVPSQADISDLPAPSGIEICWLPRRDRGYGRLLVAEVRRALGLGELSGVPTDELPELPSDLDVEVWETPRHSSAGEDIEAQLHQRTLGTDLDGLYAWIAGESWAVKVLRRSLVRELGVDRAQVAFMGYWREGVAMRS